MRQLVSSQAVEAIRVEIAACKGNEVFFLGKTDESRLVVSVEPLARGNKDAVAAIMVTASFGDVVIHNHPSGDLTPSMADLNIAATLGNQGVGFYIVNNDATDCYQAVTPFSHKKLEYLSLAEIDVFFAPDGVMAANLHGYEHRGEQTRMSFAVAEAFNRDRVALIEAGTGTGKSLAYLLPAALWAKRNKERVVVSTNTINLQEQLTGKDIPFLQKHGGLSFKAVLIKGRGNYLCLRKLNAHREEPGLFADEKSELQAIIEWSDSTPSGSIDDLGFIPKDEVWEELRCEGDQCSRTKCRNYSRCYYYSSRRNASSADILVVNHALLMSDLALRQQSGSNSTAILPPYQRLIIDEAHHLEDVATGSLSSQVTRHGLLKLLGKLQHPRRPDRGLLPKLAASLLRELPDAFEEIIEPLTKLLEEDLLLSHSRLTDLVNREMDGIAFALGGHLKPADAGKGEQKLRLTPSVYASDFWEESLERISSLAKGLSAYASSLAKLHKMLRSLPEGPAEKLSGQILDIKGVLGRLEGSVEAITAFVGHSEFICRWFEVKRGGKGVFLKLCSSPLDVAASMKNALFDKIRTVILTSATLTVGGKFDYMGSRIGIPLLPQARVSELLLASPFNYAEQVFAGVPSDIPEPTSRDFEPAAAELIFESLSISMGGAFVLFTSYDLLRKVYNRIASRLEAIGLSPMRQGESGRHQLLSRFRSTTGGVLFGTDSFWEGVDVQGDALGLVIITRLPFRVPTEPILEARSEYISAAGKDPFMEYTVPQAVIKFKQGFGRLIRSRDDRGGVLILDRRVLSKGYGRIFLKSLPDLQVTATGKQEMLDGLQRFYFGLK
ncbi:MAG: DEAD/DEAH box helicase family protein [Geobacteraceae bacterium]|nr:DEAD/DEAH box helicase family protein [Geobacteraceae bacterium]